MAVLLKGRIDRFWRSLALVIVLVIAGLFYFDWHDYRTASVQVEQARNLQQQTNLLLAAVTDAETGERGYILTGDPKYLVPYQSALKELPGRLEKLTRDAAAANRDAADVARLRILIPEKIYELKRTITLRDQYGEQSALALIRTDAGLLTMNEIRSTCRELNASEELAIHDLTRKSGRGGSVLAIVLIGCVGLVLLLWRMGAAVESVVKEREEYARSIDESRQQLQTTLASIGDAVIVTDAPGRVRFMNPVAAKLTGWTAADAEKKPLSEVFHIIDEKKRQNGGDDAGSRLIEHTVLVSRDGTEIPIEETGAPIRAAAGKALGVVVVFRDVTARRIAERELERWKQIFSGAGFGMFVADARTGLIIDMNPTFAAMHDYSVSELLGRSLQVLVPPGSAPELASALRVVGEKGRHMFEGQHVRQDGSEFPSLVDVTTFHDGRVQLLAGYCSDITERKRFEDALRESEERFRTLASALPQLVWSADASGKIDYVNQECIAYAGWKTGEEARKYLPLYPWQDLLHPEDREEYHTRWHNSLRTGATFETQARLRRARDGAWHWFLCRAVAVRDRTGMIVRWLGGCTDIQQQMEAARQMQLANQALQQSNSDLEQFAYAASHDLQEPLRMVSIYSELLKEEYGDSLDRHARSYIDFAVNGARRMSQLLKDLLTYSRVSNGNASPGKMPAADARAAVASALLNLATVVNNSHAEVQVGSLPAVEIPEIHLVQLFQNLIGNALKYSKEGVQPCIRINAQPANGSGWKFSVRDNGIGIEPEYLQQIFGIFRRLHGSDYEGTGIGLALCQKIVERAGGRIWAESEPGEGSTFFFTLHGVETEDNELSCKNTAGGG